MRPIFAALAVLILCAIAGVILVTLDRSLIGVVVFIASVPAALVAWVVAVDRA